MAMAPPHVLNFGEVLSQIKKFVEMRSNKRVQLMSIAVQKWTKSNLSTRYFLKLIVCFSSETPYFKASDCMI